MGLCFFFFYSVLKIKFVGDEEEQRSLQMTGLNLMHKELLCIGSARLSFSIWDVGGLWVFCVGFFCWWFSL